MNPVKRGSGDLEMGPTPEGSPGPEGVAQSSITQVLHLHDERTQIAHLGVSPCDFGAVAAKLRVFRMNLELVRCILRVLPKKSMIEHVNRSNN